MKSRLKKLWGLLVGLEFKHISVIFLGLCILFSGGIYEGTATLTFYSMLRLNKFTGTVVEVFRDMDPHPLSDFFNSILNPSSTRK